MKNCPAWGSENQDNARWCVNCKKILQNYSAESSDPISAKQATKLSGALAKKKSSSASSNNPNYSITKSANPTAKTKLTGNLIHQAGSSKQKEVPYKASETSGFAHRESTKSPSSSHADVIPNRVLKPSRQKNTTSGLQGSMGGMQFTPYGSPKPEKSAAKKHRTEKSRKKNSKTFCSHCGARLKKSDVYCARCGKHVPMSRKQTKHKHGWFFWTVLVLILMILAVLAFLACTFFYKDRNNAKSTLAYDSSTMDVETYYEATSTIIRKTGVPESTEIQTAAEISSEFIGRGFEEFEITSDYSIDGAYLDSTVISEDSQSEHPMFDTYYITGRGELWTITSINGSVTAYPVSYNMERNNAVEVILSESKSLVCYDCDENQFYEVIPDEDYLIVKVVDRINAETLEMLTFEAIDAL